MMEKVLTILLVLVVATPTMAAHRGFSGGYPSSAARARGTRSQGLKVGAGAMTPMEARLEQSQGNTDAKSERISNARRAGRKIQKAIPGAEQASDGENVRYVKISKGCACEKQTVTASGGAKVGIGKTAAEARSKASSSKATW